MRLKPDEFIRRFVLHALPDRFHRIRQFGFLANGHRTERPDRCRSLLTNPVEPPALEKQEPAAADPEDLRIDPPTCPECGGAMRIIENPASRSFYCAKYHGRSKRLTRSASRPAPDSPSAQASIPPNPNSSRRPAEPAASRRQPEPQSAESPPPPHKKRRQRKPPRAFVQSGFNEVRFHATANVVSRTSQKPPDSRLRGNDTTALMAL
jgi:hypothetical protein